MKLKKIILASTSPRRKHILKQMGVNFEIVPSPYQEVLMSNTFTYDKIENLAINKAQGVLPFVPPDEGSLILAADTVVVFDNTILGKPSDFEEAQRMLKLLSGEKHFVVTSICVINPKTGAQKVLSTTSFVEFNVLTNAMIKNYIEKCEPYDKAGAYGIQELPAGFVKNVTGSFENIIGLCPKAVSSLLQP